jgi:hypothetical protein
MQITFNDINQLDALLNKYKRVEFVFEFTPFSRDENLLWQAKIKETILHVVAIRADVFDVGPADNSNRFSIQ